MLVGGLVRGGVIATTATATRRTTRRIVRGVGARGGAKYSGGLRGIFAGPKRGGDEVAASIGRDAFLDPDILTVPLSLFAPKTSIFCIIIL